MSITYTFVTMRVETQGRLVCLATTSGVLHGAGTLYLNEKFSNHHTKQAVARSLRVWICLADAYDIDLAKRATEGRWLTEAEKRSLQHLAFRPIEEIEAMSASAVRSIGSAVRGRGLASSKRSVQSNTAAKQLVGIAQFLDWFHDKLIAPRMPGASSISDALRREVRKCSGDLKSAIRGAKSAHPHMIRSVPSARFLEIYSAIFLDAPNILRSKVGREGRHQLRDRAMLLLAGEGLRPGAIGNLRIADFRWDGPKNLGYVVLKDNTARRSKSLSAATPVQKGASSKQNYNSELTVSIWPTTANAVRDYIDSEREAVTTRTLKNRSEGFLFLGGHGGPISDRGTIAHVFRRAGKGLAARGLLSRDPKDPYLVGEEYSFNAYLLRHSAASMFYSAKSQELKSDVVEDLMKSRFGWSRRSEMPSLYARRAMTDAASLTVEDFIESLMEAARVAKKD